MQKALSNCGSKQLNALDTQITEVVHQLQDSLESHTSNFFISIQQPIPSPLFIDLTELRHEIASFTVTAKKLEKNYIQELEHPNSEDDCDHKNSAAAILTNSLVKMVGLSDAIADMKDHDLRITRPDYFGTYAFFGGAGNGRSMVAAIATPYA